jgi:hypothetical protein
VLFCLGTLTVGMTPRNIHFVHDIFNPELIIPNVSYCDEQLSSKAQTHVSRRGRRHGTDGLSCLKYTLLTRATWDSLPIAP